MRSFPLAKMCMKLSSCSLLWNYMNAREESLRVYAPYFSKFNGQAEWIRMSPSVFSSTCLSMYVCCMYVCIIACIYICIYVCMYVVYVCCVCYVVYICIYVCTYLSIYQSIHFLMHQSVWLSTYQPIYLYVYTGILAFSATNVENIWIKMHTFTKQGVYLTGFSTDDDNRNPVQVQILHCEYIHSHSCFFSESVH